VEARLFFWWVASQLVALYALGGVMLLFRRYRRRAAPDGLSTNDLEQRCSGQ
jgi:hypothetical protein